MRGVVQAVAVRFFALCKVFLVQREATGTAYNCEFRFKLDTHSTANWTAIPEQTGHSVHGKLDSKIGM